jgi:ribulose-phosphate 3-epimerase
MIVSLSILNIEENDRKNKIKEFMQAGDNWIHFDVMDGAFVENKTFKYEVVKEVKEYCSLFKDVHLMTYNPLEFINEYKDAGADQITFHYESVKKEEVEYIINEIISKGLKVGLSVKPGTDIKEIEKFLPLLDLVLVMSVEPGKGGQKFMESSLDKIKWLSERKKDNNYLISVDGGINYETSKLVKNAGCDVVVVGTYLTRDIIKKEKVLDLI